MLTSIRNVKFYKNAFEYNVYHRCLCYFLNLVPRVSRLTAYVRTKSLVISVKSCCKLICVNYNSSYKRHSSKKMMGNVRISVKPRPNDHNMPAQHIAKLLGATRCKRLATVLRCVATCWVLLAQNWTNFKLEPTTPNMSQRVATWWPKPRPNDHNMPTQHITTLLRATCCVRLATVFATCWVLVAQV